MRSVYGTLCSLLTFVIVASPIRAIGEPFGLGFPPFDPKQSILESTDLLPTVVRLAVTVPLSASAPSKGSKVLEVVSDGLSVSSDYSRWSYRLRKGSKFSNGEPVTAQDVIFSVERCAAQGKLPGFLSATAHLETGSVIDWVEIVIKPNGAEAAKSFAAAMGSCPVLEHKTAVSFGGELGIGSNLVSGGPYTILTFVPGRKYILNRIRRSSRDRVGLDQIELRAFQTADQGLAALRVGTIGALACDEGEVIHRAKNDETLLVEPCSGYSMIRRRGVKVACVEALVVTDIGEGT